MFEERRKKKNYFNALKMVYPNQKKKKSEKVASEPFNAMPVRTSCVKQSFRLWYLW